MSNKYPHSSQKKNLYYLWGKLVYEGHNGFCREDHRIHIWVGLYYVGNLIGIHIQEFRWTIHDTPGLLYMFCFDIRLLFLHCVQLEELLLLLMSKCPERQKEEKTFIFWAWCVTYIVWLFIIWNSGCFLKENLKYGNCM